MTLRKRLASLAVCTLAVSGAPAQRAASAPFYFAPTTTLTAETANNTSAADSFAGSSNGNLAAGSVSKLPVRSLLYAGANTKILTAMMGWWGKKEHISIGYRSDDAAQIQRQVDDMVSRGFDGTTLAWYGSDEDELSNKAAKLLMKASERAGGFAFALRPNEGIIKWSKMGLSPTDTLIFHLKYAAKTYFPSSAYLRIDDRPVLMFFGFEKYDIDWERLRQAIGGDPIFVFRNPNGFNYPYSDGAFAWSMVADTAYIDRFFDRARHSGGKLAFGNAYKGFDDSAASWTEHRKTDQRCGQTWLSTMAYAAKYYNSSHQLPFLQVATWNDYEEGTEIETGIDNCLSITPQIDGGRLRWALSGAGSENTVDHYTVFLSKDGKRLMPLGDVESGTHTFDLPRQLPVGSWTLFVKAVGRPSIRNVLSAPIAYKVVQ